ncbi:MAG: extracellular solute-binding protein, partial [Candidatus Parcubacteria bacterium]|nr:extracellular solute-binding protein [Candidatus Parcubacteria bacterium]
FLATTGAKCGSLPAGVVKEGSPKPITLKYWKVFEESDNISELIAEYQKINPYVSIQYENFRYDEYEDKVINALAEDRGPDIFSIQTTWMRKYQSKIQPMPAQLKLFTSVQMGTIQKQTYTKEITKKTLTTRDLNTLFPEVVVDNQLIGGQVYGLPLSIDTLALFYNKDLLNNAGITAPPTSWDQLLVQVGKLTKRDPQKDIIQAGVALGTADNVTRAGDILSLLMMQVGAPMTDINGYPTLSTKPLGYAGEDTPAVSALNFYNRFAVPSNEVYSWNESMPNSKQAFIQGLTAFYFGYAYDIPTIKTQAPKLNFEVSAMPQLSQPSINFANYWAETVSKKSQYQNEAWDFILFITTNQEINKKYVTKSQKPVALRALIEWQQDDVVLAPFVGQILTARSWYKGKNPQAADTILNSMITDNLTGAYKTLDLVSQANSKLGMTMQ